MRGHPLDTGVPPAWACAWGQDASGVFASFAVGDVEQRMRWIAPGRFLRGSPKTEAGRWPDEGPQHPVAFKRGFWLAETPCTQALWEVVMGSNPSKVVDPDRPVDSVSWDDCQAFLERIGGVASAGPDLRLPTEAEWEYACRAGTTTATWAGNLTIDESEGTAPELDAIASYAGNQDVERDLDDRLRKSTELAGTRPVGTRQPNPWGLHDMLGNVWEWCSDWQSTYTAAAADDPQGAATGTDRVLRGGSWRDQARFVRAAVRGWDLPGDRYSDVGLRLARGHNP